MTEGSEKKENIIEMSRVFAEEAKKFFEYEELLASSSVQKYNFWQRFKYMLNTLGSWATGKKFREFFDKIAYLEKSLKIAHYTNSVRDEKIVSLEKQNVHLSAELEGIREQNKRILEWYEESKETKSPWVDITDFQSSMKVIQEKLDNIFERVASIEGCVEENHQTFEDLHEKLKKVDVLQITANTSNVVNEKMKDIQDILSTFKTFIETLRSEYATQSLSVTKECRRVALELTDTKSYYNALRTWLVRVHGVNAVSSLPTIHIQVTPAAETKVIEKEQ